MKIAVLDIETSGLGWGDRIFSIAVASRNEQGERVASINVALSDLFHQPATTPEIYVFIQEAIAGADWVVGHNLSFDLPYLVRDNLLTIDQLRGKIFDSLIVARMTGSHASASLESLCDEYKIGFASEADEQFWHMMKGKREHLEQCSPSEVLRYDEMDTTRTLLLFDQLLPLALDQYNERRIREEGDYVLLIAQMRVNGIPLDMQRVTDTLQEKRARLAAINTELLTWKIRGPNDRTGTLALLDQHKVRLGLTTTEKGNPSLDEASLLGLPSVKDYIDLKAEPEDTDEWRRQIESLESHAYVPAIALILEAREVAKQCSTWLEPFLDQADERGFVHPLWGAGGTVSYRLNCVAPPAQTVSKRLSLWGVPEGYYRVEIDLEQAELKVGAAYAAENQMAEMFANGIDVHTGTASLMYEVSDLSYFKASLEGKIKRRHAKQANFCGFYGGGWKALDEALHVGEQMARKIVKMWRKTYRAIFDTAERAEKVWVKRGYVVLCHGKHLWASPDDLIYRVYKAFNQLVQGSIAEIIRVAMMRIDRVFPDVIIVGQIHDSIIMLVPIEGTEEVIPELVRIVETSAPEEILRRTNPPIQMTADVTVYDAEGEIDPTPFLEQVLVEEAA